MTAPSAGIEHLRAEARYAQERYDLYRAKMYGARPTSKARLNELERAHRGAQARLHRAEQVARQATRQPSRSPGR
jgi:hypothetical protein